MSTIQFDQTITLNEPTIHMRDEIPQGVKLFIVDEYGDSCIMSFFKNREGEKLLYTDREDPSEDPGYDFMKCRFWGYLPDSKPVRGTVDRLLYDYPKLKDLVVFSRCTEDDESVFCIVNGNAHAEIMYCPEETAYWKDPETLEWSDDPKTIEKIYKHLGIS